MKEDFDHAPEIADRSTPPHHQSPRNQRIFQSYWKIIFKIFGDSKPVPGYEYTVFTAQLWRYCAVNVKWEVANGKRLVGGISGIEDPQYYSPPGRNDKHISLTTVDTPFTRGWGQ